MTTDDMEVNLEHGCHENSEKNGAYYHRETEVEDNQERSRDDPLLDKESSSSSEDKDVDDGCVPFRKDLSKSSSPSLNITAGQDFVQIARKGYIKEKLVFMVSVVTIIMMAFGLTSLHWLLPYYYAVSAPLLILVRVVMYWKNKWQYFLIDFCYFGNALCYGYLWAAPSSEIAFAVVFALSNGPLAWAVGFYRNSVVFHSIDKMTSVYIHTLPPFLTYCIRWYPVSASSHWYQPFVSVFSDSWTFYLTWLVLVPFACFVLHSITYMVMVFAILKPGEEYQYSYRYLITRSGYARATNVCGPRFQFALYHVFYWIYCLMALVTSVLLYHSFIAHSIFTILFCLIGLWNGATFYMDVFSVRGHSADS